jgi:O-antigen/teichoic acid export membrane protein
VCLKLPTNAEMSSRLTPVIEIHGELNHPVVPDRRRAADCQQPAVRSGLARGASWMLMASIAAACAQWLAVALTAKLGTTEMVGELALALAITAPIQTLTDLALRPAFATDVRCQFPFRDYARLRVVGILTAVTIGAAAALWNGGASGWIILALGLQKGAESASDLIYGLFQKEERLNWSGQSIILRSVISTAAFAVILGLTRNLAVACFAGVLIRVLLMVALDSPRASALLRLQPLIRTDLPIRALVLHSLPLTAGLFLMSVTVNIPRYFVSHRIGIASLGLFAALLYVFQAGAMLIDAVGQAASVRLSRFHQLADKAQFWKLTLQLTGFAALAALCGIVLALTAGGPILRLAYSASFATQSRVFLLLSLAALPWYCSSMLGYVLVARRQMTALFACQALALLATAATSYLGIASRLEQASQVVLISYTILAILYVTVLLSSKGQRIAAHG